MHVTRRRFTILATVLVAINVFFGLAGSSLGMAGGSGSLVQSLLGGRMIRAEILWLTPDGKVQDTRLDRGIVVALATDSISIKEKDGSTQTIALAPNITVRLGLQTVTTANLRRGQRVVVAQKANEPADTIQIEGYGG